MGIFNFSKKFTAVNLSFDYFTTVKGIKKGNSFFLEGYEYTRFDDYVFEPNFKGFSIKNRDKVKAVIDNHMSTAGIKNKNISLVIPEQAIKVMVLPFENFPSNNDEARDVLVWKLKNIYGPEIENFNISFQDFKNTKENIDYVLIGLANQKTINEITELFSQFDINLVKIEIPSLSIYNIFDSRLHAYGEGDYYFVTFTSNSINIMLFEGYYPVFYRSTSLMKSPILIEDDIFEEIIQALRVSILYNEENRRGKVVNQIYFFGDALKKQAMEETLLKKLGENYVFTCLNLRDEIEFLCEYRDVRHVIAPAIGILF